MFKRAVFCHSSRAAYSGVIMVPRKHFKDLRLIKAVRLSSTLFGPLSGNTKRPHNLLCRRTKPLAANGI